MKTLIVEDNALTRMTLRVLLEKAGHQVAGEVADGSLAMAEILRVRPEVVFLDLILPGRSGVELLSEIKNGLPTAKVVVITALMQTELDGQLLEKGAALVLHKPFSYTEFKEALLRLG